MSTDPSGKLYFCSPFYHVRGVISVVLKKNAGNGAALASKAMTASTYDQSSISQSTANSSYFVDSPLPLYPGCYHVAWLDSICEKMLNTFFVRLQ